MSDDYFEDLTPEAAKQEITAKFADPAFMKVYTDGRWAGHAEAVAEMARLFEQAYPPGEGCWPRMAEALRLVARMFGMSIGRAGAMICAACADRLIRWECNFHTPTIADWQTGHIDARGDLVTENRRYDGVRLSGDDLLHWLRQQPETEAKAETPERIDAATQAAAPTEERALTHEQVRQQVRAEMRRRAKDEGGLGSMRSLAGQLAAFAAALPGNRERHYTNVDTIRTNQDLNDLYRTLPRRSGRAVED